MSGGGGAGVKCRSQVWASEWNGACAVVLRGAPLVQTKTQWGGRVGSGAGFDQGCGFAKCRDTEEAVGLRVGVRRELL